MDQKSIEMNRAGSSKQANTVVGRCTLMDALEKLLPEVIAAVKPFEEKFGKNVETPKGQVPDTIILEGAEPDMVNK